MLAEVTGRRLRHLTIVCGQPLRQGLGDGPGGGGNGHRAAQYCVSVGGERRLGFTILAADQRDYAMCLPMLEHLGVKSLRLMTNNPRKVKALTDMGIVVSERVPLHTGHNPHNKLYLATKASKLDHMMGNEHQGEADRA